MYLSKYSNLKLSIEHGTKLWYVHERTVYIKAELGWEFEVEVLN